MASAFRAGHVPADGNAVGEGSFSEGRQWNKAVEEEAEEDAKKDLTAEYHGHEKELLQQMREAIKAADVPLDQVTDRALMRFLRARGMNVAKSSKLYIDDVQWRKEYFAKGPIPPNEVGEEIKAGKSFLVAKPGQRSWIYMFAKQHDSTKRDMEVFKKFAVFAIEKAVECLPPEEEAFGAVLDLGEAQYKNLDSRALIAILDTLQAHYPERLFRLYLIHVPYIFWGVWKVVYPLIDHRTRQKIRFLEDKVLKETLSKEIPVAVLPKLYGGEADLVNTWEKS